VTAVVMNILIADDEPVARQILREHAEAIPSVEIVGEASNGAEALDRILDLKPDLVFLDLEMPEMNGLSVVRSLRGEKTPLIIFVTAYQQHALEAFEVGAVDYLLKPVRQDRLSAAVEKARRQLQGSRTDAPNVGNPAASDAAANKDAAAPSKVVGRRGADMYLLEPGEIVAFQAEGELVHIITAGQRYLSDHSLKALEEKLPRPRFRRIHRSTLINTDHIRKISPLSSKRWLLKMSNGFEAVVSKRLAGSIREQAKW
jgi:two-component system, LytTR family, response regulator